MLSVSILSIKEDLENKLKLLDTSNMNYFHIDVEDGIFVPNKTNYMESLSNVNLNKPLDIHLMVKDVIKYIDMYSTLNPLYLTFHKEATDDVEETIKYIKDKNIKVGLSINPNTKINSIKKYLKDIDLVLLMSVNPGMGGQKFIDKTYKRVKKLKKLQKKYNFKIEVDGGVNNTNISKIGADIFVVGSYITKSDNYLEKIDELNSLIKSC